MEFSKNDGNHIYAGIIPQYPGPTGEKLQLPPDLRTQVTNVIINLRQFLINCPDSVLDSLFVYVMNHSMAAYVIDQLTLAGFGQYIKRCQVVGWRKNHLLVSLEVAAHTIGWPRAKL